MQHFALLLQVLFQTVNNTSFPAARGGTWRDGLAPRPPSYAHRCVKSKVLSQRRKRKESGEWRGEISGAKLFTEMRRWLGCSHHSIWCEVDEKWQNIQWKTKDHIRLMNYLFGYGRIKNDQKCKSCREEIAKSKLTWLYLPKQTCKDSKYNASVTEWSSSRTERPYSLRS